MQEDRAKSSWLGVSKGAIQSYAERQDDKRLKDWSWRGDAIEARYKETVLIMDVLCDKSLDVPIYYTRIRGRFKTNDEFRFTIYREGPFSKFLKLFGMQDIEIGDDAFDQQFIIKATDKEKAIDLFKNEALKELLSDSKDFHLSIYESDLFGPKVEKLPPGIQLIAYQERGIIREPEKIYNIFSILVETLEHLQTNDRNSNQETEGSNSENL